MQILLPRGQSAPDMALRFIHVQHLAGLRRQGRIDLQKTVGDVLMYRALTHPKLLRRLPHRGLVLNDIICDLNRPLLNIILQEKSPCIVRFYNLCRGRGSYSKVKFTIPKIPLSSFHPFSVSVSVTGCFQFSIQIGNVRILEDILVKVCQNIF